MCSRKSPTEKLQEEIRWEKDGESRVSRVEPNLEEMKMEMEMEMEVTAVGGWVTSIHRSRGIGPNF